MIDIAFLSDFGFSIIRLTTPIVFATLAAVISARAGVVNIGIEGMMLVSALLGVVISAWTHDLILTCLIVGSIGAFMGFVFILIVERLKSNAVLTGLAFNIMASGGTVFLLWLITGDKGASTTLKSLVFPNIGIPLLDRIPLLGGALSNHNVLTYFAFGCVLVLYVLLYKTALGLRIRSVGESQDAALSVGIDAFRIRVVSLTISGALASFGGMFMSMGYLSWFSTNMTAGRGFIGLVAEAMGNGTPIGGMLVSLIFGGADAIANTLQTRFSIPSELVQMLPYLVTIIGLAAVGWSSKQRSAKTSKGQRHE